MIKYTQTEESQGQSMGTQKDGTGWRGEHGGEGGRVKREDGKKEVMRRQYLSFSLSLSLSLTVSSLISQR